ncbi:MAG: hypothetical protein C4575_13070 [Desulforudis sp.]|nr:MAG: hypothetical protein C4575_13070 [Desulforudis sp.]
MTKKHNFRRPVQESAIPTTERLALALEALGDPRLVDVIANARAGVYDDFKTTLVFPQIALVKKLNALGHFEFSHRVIDGEFDATMEESLAWMESQEGQRAMQELLR